MLHTIHSKNYCKNRIKEIRAKNKGKEMSLGDVLLLENFKKVLKSYNVKPKNDMQCGVVTNPQVD
jgi:hypothetical protein